MGTKKKYFLYVGIIITILLFTSVAVILIKKKHDSVAFSINGQNYSKTYYNNLITGAESHKISSTDAKKQIININKNKHVAAKLSISVSSEQTYAGAENSVVVTTVEGKDYALKNKIAFIETSAKEGKGVSSAFQHLLHAIYNVDSNRQRMTLQQGKEMRQHNNWTNIHSPSFDLRNSEDNRSVSSRGAQKKGCCHLGG